MDTSISEQQGESTRSVMVRCEKRGGQMVEKEVAFEGIRDDDCRCNDWNCCVP